MQNSFDQIEKAIAVSPVLPDLADDRDFSAGAILAEPVGIPDAFDLRAEQSAVKNQGSRGTCTAHAGCGIAEFFNRREHKNPDLDLSEEYLYKKTKEVDVKDYGFNGYGAYLRSLAKALTQSGACLESTLPYEGNAPEDHWQNVSISPSAEKEAHIFRSAYYAAVACEVAAIKQAIYSARAPVIAGIMLYADYRSAKDTGRIPAVRDGAKIGGHAVLIVGWTADSFIIKNSWGSGWGDHGYIYWPFARIADVFNVWSIVDSENPAIVEERLIEANKKRVPEWALPSWEKAIKKGFVTGNTRPLDQLSKAEYFVFLDREGRLG